jgi:hypothetical protein
MKLEQNDRFSPAVNKILQIVHMAEAVGDRCILQRDALTDHPPFLLARDKLGKLVIAD